MTSGLTVDLTAAGFRPGWEAGRNHQTYTTMGNLRLKMAHQGEATDYFRRLDLDEPVVCVGYRLGDARHDREIFATAADRVIVIRLTCDKPGRISFDAVLDTPHALAKVTPKDNAGIVLAAKAPWHACNRSLKKIRQLGDTHKYPDLFDAHRRPKVDADIVYAQDRRGKGMGFQVHLRAIAAGGRVSADEKGLHVSGADEVTLRLASLIGENSNPNLFAQCYAGRPLPFDIDPNFGGTGRVRADTPLAVTAEGKAVPVARPEGSVVEFRTGRGGSYLLGPR